MENHDNHISDLLESIVKMIKDQTAYWPDDHKSEFFDRLGIELAARAALLEIIKHNGLRNDGTYLYEIARWSLGKTTENLIQLNLELRYRRQRENNHPTT